MKTTMKKVLSMALALVLLLGVFPMTALADSTTCEGENHVMVDGWQKDANWHWQVCVCGAKTPNGGAHVAGINGTCTTCGYVLCTPTHTFDTQVCTSPRTCSTCGYVDPARASHTATTWSSDTTSHWHVCSVCSATFDANPHDGGSANCTDQAACTTCGRAYGATNTTHIVEGSTLTSNENQHYRICSCGEYFDYNDHVWEAATASTPETCSVCRRTRNAALGSATIRVNLLIGGTSQSAGSFTITAGGTKTANDILNAYLATSSYSASSISSSYVVAEGSSTQYTGNQSLAIAASGVYVLNVTPVNSTNNTQSNTNGIYVSFVPNYNTYTYATYVAGPLASGVKLYTIPHNISRTGYTLEGWYYDAALTQKVPTDAVVTTSATFYAKWTQVAPYNVSVVIYTNGNKTTPTVTLDLYSWAQDGVITLEDVKQAVANNGIKANNNAGLSVYGPFTPNQWTSYVSHDYYRNSTERVSVNAGEATVLYAMVHNVKITKGTVDPYGAIADKTNPKTGDMIYAPMMVLGLSASALAVLFYLNKKRAF